MQMGFNNDVDYKGLVVHIQTEDHGLRTKKITSQVFHGGAILESKTVSYEEDIAAYPDNESRDDRIRLLMKALHRKCYNRIHKGLYDDGLPIGEVQVSAAHLTVQNDEESVALETPDELIAGEGFSVAGVQADMAEEYANHSRGEHLEIAESEPGQLTRVAEDMAAAAASMDTAGFVPLGGVGASGNTASSLDAARPDVSAAPETEAPAPATEAPSPVSAAPAPAAHSPASAAPSPVEAAPVPAAPAPAAAAVLAPPGASEPLEFLYGATTTFRGLDVDSDDLGAVILEAVYSQ